MRISQGSGGSKLVPNGIFGVYNVLAVIAFALMPRMHAFGETAMANALVATALVGHSYVVFAFGTQSNLHVYFTMAGAVLFFVGIENWRNFLVLFACSIAALVNVLVNASPQGFVLPGDAALRASLSLQALVSATLLNAIVIAFALSALYRTEQRLQREFDRAENLLASILPPAIAKRLKAAGRRRIADRVENASVLFVDLVGFTAMAGKADPEEVVDYLHRLFRRFDALCEAHGVDKIKTIGDCYMAAGGLTGRAEGSAARRGWRGWRLPWWRRRRKWSSAARRWRCGPAPIAGR